MSEGAIWGSYMRLALDRQEETSVAVCANIERDFAFFMRRQKRLFEWRLVGLARLEGEREPPLLRNCDFLPHSVDERMAIGFCVSRAGFYRSRQ